MEIALAPVGKKGLRKAEKLNFTLENFVGQVMARQCYGMRRLNVMPIAWQGARLWMKTCHESWNFPAGVSFALKQNMYWGGFCAFLPDISGLGGGGGGPNPCKNQQI